MRPSGRRTLSPRCGFGIFLTGPGADAPGYWLSPLCGFGSGTALPHLASYHRSKRQPEKPLESTAKLDSMAASGAALRAISDRRMSIVSGVSKTRNTGLKCETRLM